MSIPWWAADALDRDSAEGSWIRYSTGSSTPVRSNGFVTRCCSWARRGWAASWRRWKSWSCWRAVAAIVPGVRARAPAGCAAEVIRTWWRCCPRAPHSRSRSSGSGRPWMAGRPTVRGRAPGLDPRRRRGGAPGSGRRQRLLKVLEEPPAHCRFLRLGLQSHGGPAHHPVTVPAAVAARAGGGGESARVAVPAGLARAVLAGADLEGPVEAVRAVLGLAFDGEVEGATVPARGHSTGGLGDRAGGGGRARRNGRSERLGRGGRTGAAGRGSVGGRKTGDSQSTADRQLVSALLRWYRGLPQVKSQKSKV